MFGYDSDSDRCFEMHVGTLPASDRVGQCFVDTISAYNLDLPRFDYKTSAATDRSDHGPFWHRDIGAIEILENMFDDKLADQGQPLACPNGDMDPNYHTEKDTADQINPESGIPIVRAAIATVASMAGLLP
jgi:leucyl aminopeptidase